MAIKVIKKPTTLFTMECQRCDCVFTYTLQDTYKSFTTDYVECPCCKEQIAHYERKEHTEGEG